MQADVLIVGAGQAGGQAAISLRQGGFSGSIVMLGDEPLPPYERPPLSKEYLSGERPADKLLLRPAAFWADRQIELLTGRLVCVVDHDNRTATCADGSAITYGKLIWAAGGRARRLTCPGAALAGVHTIRNQADIDALRPALAEPRRVVIIGGGYIGLEAAAVLRKLGHAVTLVEALDRVLARVTAPTISRFFEAEHRAHGVDIRLGAEVEALEGDATGRVAAVRLRDGAALPADLVIVGIGLVPCTSALAQAGVLCGHGVEVDGFCRTSLPDIHAIGDCANHPNPFAGGHRVRLKSVQNAVDQARCAAADILGQGAPYAALPWFWSNQYDLRMQTAGLSLAADHTLLRGDPATRSFSLLHMVGDRIVAIDCINSPRDFTQAKSLIEKAVPVRTALLADPGTALRDCRVTSNPNADQTQCN